MIRKSFPAHAADAYIDDIAYKYKVGDKIKTPDGVGTVQKKTHTNSGKPAYEVKLDKGGIVVHVEQSVSAADADNFKLGDLVRMNEGGLTGKITKIEPNGHFRVSFLYNRANGFSQSFSANEIVMVKPAKDSADADKSKELEREIKGDVVAVVSGNAARVSKDVSFATAKEGVESFARKNGVSVVSSQEYGEAYKFKFSAAIDCSTDAAEVNKDADLRAALSKMADIAKRLTDAKVSFKAGWTPDGIGEIILEFPNIESARKYNYYKLFNAWEAARSQIVPRWAVNIGGYRVPRIEGNRMTIGISHFST